MKKAFIPLCVFFAACGSHVSKSDIKTDTPCSTVVQGKLFTSIFQQKAAEYRALCYQAYNIATFRIDTYRPLTNKPLAVVTDLDETTFDNSPYQIREGLKGKDFEPATWAEWTALGVADTLAGSVSFFKFAASKGVEVFYITNRDKKDYQGTLQNLKHYGFPYADSAHLIIRQNVSSKEVRRQALEMKYEIALLIGDNLSDFSSLFDSKTMAERRKNTDAESNLFGYRYIMLPNSTYGDWEPALYGKKGLTLAQKDSVIRAIGVGF